ncbi:MAG: hypothetical protein JWR51_4697 [Devosia sp.]|uniref:hypothetical protein n=1 Tax=Devosia sp. TaxID=1871048 RepID=UPI002606F2FB|nr:hypothetical protein [Devosia sp.]MDB5531594.1 hypothetical protein [Devosia sp.]
MTDIPEDVMKAATEAVCTAYDEGEAIMTVALAILAERERSKKEIADLTRLVSKASDWAMDRRYDHVDGLPF